VSNHRVHLVRFQNHRSHPPYHFGVGEDIVRNHHLRERTPADDPPHHVSIVHGVIPLNVRWVTTATKMARWRPERGLVQRRRGRRARRARQLLLLLPPCSSFPSSSSPPRVAIMVVLLVDALVKVDEMNRAELSKRRANAGQGRNQPTPQLIMRLWGV